ncbi:phosphoglyceromutase [Reticulomyxa filosa]|uniref:Phosphoglyceromutase n=1 Tax=Reticulomyxa filosa TaxID=46433 RepID=X6MQ05_RETFI|nr:phosphoglyceromutase [Reticulomyxa filosa]|eukprot:ETO16088.1 phosphoglyceromutase [Reticulomyxa filosa]
MTSSSVKFPTASANQLALEERQAASSKGNEQEKNVMDISFSGRLVEEVTKDTELYLVRHGETEWNVVHKYQGQKDSNLTEKGKLQAVHVGQRLAHIHRTDRKFAKVYVSPLGRARHTAKLILEQFDDADNIECIYMPELMERNFGELEV